jgi:hypothetical protein
MSLYLKLVLLRETSGKEGELSKRLIVEPHIHTTWQLR